MTTPLSSELIVAEDDATARTLLIRLAAQRGIRAEAATNGQAAMKLIGPETKAVLLDLRMPVWDGFRCLEYLAATRAGSRTSRCSTTAIRSTRRIP